MSRRWRQVIILGTVLFLTNVVTRLVVRLGWNGDDAAETRATMIMFGLIGIVLAGSVFVRSQQVPPSTWLPEVSAAAIGAMLLTVFVGPFISGNAPFDSGAGNFFSQVWLYGGFAIVGTLLGYWIATALGRDYRSKSLQAFAKAKLSKPRRVVRR